mgnify:CR=1 FL=1
MVVCFRSFFFISWIFNNFISNLISWKNENRVETLQLYGEIHGPGIQKRVNYGDKKLIKFFDCRLDGYLMSPYDFYDLMDDIGHKSKVDTLEIVKGLEAALAKDCKIYNKYNLKIPVLEAMITLKFLINLNRY